MSNGQNKAHGLRINREYERMEKYEKAVFLRGRGGIKIKHFCGGKAPGAGMSISD
jgi:hypothetical protein